MEQKLWHHLMIPDSIVQTLAAGLHLPNFISAVVMIPPNQLSVPDEIQKFVLEKGMELEYTSIFFTPPNTTTQIHIDEFALNSQQSQGRLNFAYDIVDQFLVPSQESQMVWYQCEGHPLTLGTNMKTKYFVYPQHRCVEIGSTLVQTSVVNVSHTHNVRTTKFPRVCISFLIRDVLTKQRLGFDELMGRFGG
jgi:hypothetical protein